MKLAIGFRTTAGPWGGGNRFVKALCEAMTDAGHTVVEALESPDVDLILVMDPRWRHPNVTFTSGAVLRYLMRRNSHAIVVHRINECDERKNGHGMNCKLRVANYCADHTVFVGSWLQNLDLWDKASGASSSIITNGADTRIFNANGHQPWTGKGPLKLVTHHWGNNWMKGFDVYSQLDEMLAAPKWRGRIGFTYIGNLPKGFRFKYARHISPLDGHQLANELRRHHGYVTASINEPGSNHQNEGALCSLPLLYLRSGCLPEYCAGYGIEFSAGEFVPALVRYIDAYRSLQPRMAEYPHTAARTTHAYQELFAQLLSRREQIVQQRRLWRSPWYLLRNQLPM
jgi:hypothetical protein